MIFPSPAGSCIKPAAAGVQALVDELAALGLDTGPRRLKTIPLCRRRKNPKPIQSSYTLCRTGTKYRSGHYKLEQIGTLKKPDLVNI